jgi:hypothetical protein
MCADGSPYTYWVRHADPTKVVFFLQGGGGCFDATTCAFDSRAYQVSIGADDDPSTFTQGVFDFANPRNPLADYSMVYVPYCTGDVHSGDKEQDYEGLSIKHVGRRNVAAYLKRLVPTFKDADRVVLTGSSAGGSSRASTRRPDARDGADMAAPVLAAEAVVVVMVMLDLP